jgi:hypothetical protein
MHAAAKQIGLKAGLAAQGNDAPFRHRSFGRPKLFHDPHVVVRDIAEAEPARHQGEAEEDQQHRQALGDVEEPSEGIAVGK